MGEPGFKFASFQDCLTSASNMGFNVAKTEYPKLDAVLQLHPLASARLQ